MKSLVAAPVVCKRCGRVLRRGTGPYGPKCARRIAIASAALRASRHPVALRAADLLARGGLTPIHHGRAYRVEGKGYLCSTETCTCKGARYRPTAATCYHAVAAAILSAR